MKKTFIHLFFFLSLTNLFSQNLTLDELLSLRKKQIVSAEEFLAVKNWELYSAVQPDGSTPGTITFSYKKYEEDKAVSFIKYIYTNDINNNMLNILIFNAEKYKTYLTRIKSLGCKVVYSGLKENEIIKVYQGTTTTIVVKVGTQDNDFGGTTTYYSFTIASNDDVKL